MAKYESNNREILTEPHRDYLMKETNEMISILLEMKELDAKLREKAKQLKIVRDRAIKYLKSL